MHNDDLIALQIKRHKKYQDIYQIFIVQSCVLCQKCKSLMEICKKCEYLHEFNTNSPRHMEFLNLRKSYEFRSEVMFVWADVRYVVNVDVSVYTDVCSCD